MTDKGNDHTHVWIYYPNSIMCAICEMKKIKDGKENVEKYVQIKS